MEICDKLACPDQFVAMIGLIQDRVQVWLDVDFGIAGPVPAGNGIKQGGIIEPTLFSSYLALSFIHRFAKVNRLDIYVIF